MKRKKNIFQYISVFSLLVSMAFAAPQKGFMTDSRDGQEYKTVKIGKLTWMAENLNFKMRDAKMCYDDKATACSHCYENKKANCKKYGQLYTWSAAKKACPAGWHLPSEIEFAMLISEVSDSPTHFTMSSNQQDNTKIESYRLISTNGWVDRLDKGLNGIDSVGFSALSAGVCWVGWCLVEQRRCVECMGQGRRTVFWSTDSSREEPYGVTINSPSASVYLSKDVSPWNYYSVRCVKDDREMENDYEEKTPSATSITDPRDGKIYETVKIGKQTWFAENLNYKTEKSRCFKDAPAACRIYGRLYDWKEATEACPEGWHLPDGSEWKILTDYVGGIIEANKVLRSKNDWFDWGNKTENRDEYGFSAVPAGGFIFGDFKNEGLSAYFWSAKAIYYEVSNVDGHDLRSIDCLHRTMVSVRCIKDKEPLVVKTVTGQMTDSRDGKTYKTVKIGNQVWMAENLNFEYKVNGKVRFNLCGDDNCQKYGRYYGWPAAMDYSGIYSETGKNCGRSSFKTLYSDGSEEKCFPKYPVRGVCPEGWHLPEAKEWSILFKTLDSTVVAMQAMGFESWPNATNVSEFSAIPAGFHPGNSIWNYNSGKRLPMEAVGRNAWFWTSSTVRKLLDGSYDGKSPYSWNVSKGKLEEGGYDFSIRCVKDELVNDSLRLKEQKEYLCSRSTASIIDVVRKNAPNLRKIYDGMLKKEKKFQGKIKIKFSIDDYSGNVVETAIVSSTTGNDLFDEKIKDAVSLWNFGKLQCSVSSQGREVESIQHGRKTVTIPFDFQE